MKMCRLSSIDLLNRVAWDEIIDLALHTFHNPHHSISYVDVGSTCDNNEPYFKLFVRPTKTRYGFSICQIGPVPLLPAWKNLSPRASNELRATVLIIYCQINTQADLSHSYMWRRGKFLICSFHFGWSSLFVCLLLFFQCHNTFKMHFESYLK